MKFSAKKTTNAESRKHASWKRSDFVIRASSFIRHSPFVIRHFLLLLLLATLPACGRHITDANLDRVKLDMSTKEVESILGPPTRTESPPELKSQEVKTLAVTRYVYEQNGKTVELTFVGDKLASGGVKGNFGK